MNRRIPGATYRLQFNREFTFAQARGMTSYLHDLGVTDCYSSPLFKAGSQSTHGYDVCDFGQLNPNLGSLEDFEQFVSRLRELKLGLLLDMVPNHMSTDPSNSWWFDVLEKGPESKYANWFDIDWRQFGGGKVLLPVLEDHYERVLQSGKLRLVFEGHKPFITYYDRRLPLSPEPAATISKQAAECGVDFVSKVFNGTPGQAESFERLHTLLQQQHYRPADWRTGLQEINYRRFFDINELISLRVELPDVFAAAHHLVLSLLNQGKASGLRIDHPDGLWNPQKYLLSLREKAGGVYLIVEKILVDDEALPADWPVDGTTGYDFLNRVNGLFVNQSNKAAFDQIYRQFTGFQSEFRTVVYETTKRILLDSFPSGLNLLAGQLKLIADSAQCPQQFSFDKLRELLVEIIAAFPVYRTYINEGTRELVPAEREYIEHAIADAANRLPVSDADPLRFIHNLLLLQAPENLAAAENNLCREFVMRFQQLTGPAMAKGLEDTTFYRFNRLISLNEVGGNPDSFGSSVEDFHRHNKQIAARWPHSLLATATHDTKRGEDVRARINVLSEIPDEWQTALLRWQNLNAGNKSVVYGKAAPDANDEYLLYQTLIGAWPTRDSAAEASAAFRERIVNCMLKSIKEAKVHTSWTQSNPAYEDATRKFVEQALENSSTNAFLNDFKIFQQKIAFFGGLNSLGQILLKMTAPGVPDFYQGTELWDLNLVDPDNRRPVDFEIRQRALSELKGQAEQDLPHLLADLLNQDQVGRSKLYLIWRVLDFRNRHRALFDRGAYLPLAAAGSRKDYICAFARTWRAQAAIVIVPRLVAGLTNSDTRLPLGSGTWADTNLPLSKELANCHLTNILTHESFNLSKSRSAPELPVSQIFARFPVAILASQRKVVTSR